MIKSTPKKFAATGDVWDLLVPRIQPSVMWCLPYTLQSLGAFAEASRRACRDFSACHCTHEGHTVTGTKYQHSWENLLKEDILALRKTVIYLFIFFNAHNLCESKDGWNKAVGNDGDFLAGDPNSPVALLGSSSMQVTHCRDVGDIGIVLPRMVYLTFSVPFPLYQHKGI